MFLVWTSLVFAIAVHAQDETPPPDAPPAELSVASKQTIQSIDFAKEGSESVIRVQADAPLVFEKTESPADQQVIVQVPNSVLGPNASPSIDTSAFDGPVAAVKAYPAGDVPDMTRVVIQLRAEATAAVMTEGNGFVIRVAGPKTSTAKATGAAPKKKDNLSQFVSNRPTKNFTGKRITVQVREADVRDVLRLIGEASGFNIVLGPDVQGKLTLSLVDVPWDQALDVVLQSLNLGAERNQNILRVVTLATLATSKQQEIAAKNASEAAAPRLTKVFPISYADLDSISKLIKTFGKSGPSDLTATVEIDKRTNSIVVQDIAENIDRMTKIVELLDTQTPQVLVEGKVVEATEGFTKNLGANLGFGLTNVGYASINGASFNPSTDLVTSAAQSATGSGSVGLSFGVVPNTLRINSVLTLGEQENNVKIVSSPKLVVLNKESATILQSTPVVLSASVATQGAIGTQKTVLDANVSLKVTPTVTNDEGVLLAVDISRDIPQSAGGGDTAIAKRNMQTKVLVENGNTLVIGGIYTVDRTKTESGIPFLRKIPIVGTLFGNSEDRVSRTELFIFLTPKILNTKKAGLT